MTLARIGANGTSDCSLRSSGISAMPAAAPSPGLRGRVRACRPATSCRRWPAERPRWCGSAGCGQSPSARRRRRSRRSAPRGRPGPRPSAVRPSTAQDHRAVRRRRRRLAVGVISPPTISRISRSSVASAGLQVGDEPAVAQHQDPVADRAHLVEAVPDEQHRAALLGELPGEARGPAPPRPGRARRSARRGSAAWARGPRPWRSRSSAGSGTGSVRTSRLTADRAGGQADLAPASASASAPLGRAVDQEPPRGVARAPAEQQVLGHRQLPDQRELLGDQGDAEPARRPRSSPSASRCPSISISPPSRRTDPASVPISVDLPAPFSPTTPITWPAYRSSSGRSSTRDRAVGLVHAPQPRGDRAAGGVAAIRSFVSRFRAALSSEL